MLHRGKWRARQVYAAVQAAESTWGPPMKGCGPARYRIIVPWTKMSCRLLKLWYLKSEPPISRWILCFGGAGNRSGLYLVFLYVVHSNRSKSRLARVFFLSRACCTLLPAPDAVTAVPDPDPIFFACRRWPSAHGQDMLKACTQPYWGYAPT
jgi:hypothetical protein